MKENETKKEIIRVDKNIEDWNIFVTRKSKQKSRVLKKVERLPNGSIRELTLKIGISPDGQEVGVLTATEGKIFYQFLKMQLEQELKTKQYDKPVKFHLRDLAGKLKMGWNLKKFKMHIENLAFIPLVFENSYKSSGNLITERLTLLNYVKLYDRKNKKRDKNQLELFYSEFQINPIIMKAIREHMVKPLRLDVISSFKHDIAFLLYRYLDRILYYEPDKTLSFQEIIEICGLSKDTPLWKHKQTIEEAVKELEGKELSSEGRDEIYVISKVEVRDNECVFIRGSKKVYMLQQTEQLADKQIKQQEKKLVWFRYESVTAKDVKLAGSFNNWTPEPMGQVGSKWSLPVELTPGRYEYKFLVDGEWILDPQNPYAVTKENGIVNSVLVVD